VGNESLKLSRAVAALRERLVGKALKGLCDLAALGALIFIDRHTL
jgi:hypothetical protein